MGLVARLRAAGIRQLRIALAGSVALNVGIVGCALVHIPIVRIGPICTDQATTGFDPKVKVDGEMTEAFFQAYQRALRRVDHRTEGYRIYVRISDWFEGTEIERASDQAAVSLLAERTGATQGQIRDRERGVPEFDEVESYDWPPCGGMRKLAIEGGEWAHRGPELKPEIAKGRIVPLPHLTDPLLFEPVWPREPEAADGKGDAGPR
jgi:hypothetical protein